MRRDETDWSGVAFGVALGIVAAFQQFKLPPVMPLLLDRYGYDRVLAGGFMSVYAVAGLLLSIGVGRTLHRRGVEGVVAAAILLFVAGNLLVLALPPTGMVMLTGRGLEGAGLAILAVAGPIIATAAAAPRHRPLAIALWAMWMPIGHVAANLLAVPVLAYGAWQPLWWLALVVTLAMAAWAWSRPPAVIPAMPADPGARPPRLRLATIIAAALFMLWSAQYLAFVTWLPQFLVEVHGLDPAVAALGHTVPPLLLIPFNFAAGLLLRRGWSIGRLLAGSMAVQGAVWLLAGTAGGASGIVLLGLWGAAAGITATCLFALPMTLNGGDTASSSALGMLMTGRNIGVLVGPVLLAQLLAVTADDWAVAGGGFAVVNLVAVAGSLYAARLFSGSADSRRPR